MAKKHFTQEQKLSVVEKAREIEFKEAAEIAGVHYTTVYEWQRDLQTLGREAFLNYEPSRPGRGIKEISQEQEHAILGVLETKPGYGPGQVRQQLRRQGITISMRTVRKVLEANGYNAPRKQKPVEQNQRFEATRPLELAQMDILELFINKNKIYLVLLIDDYSRFILGYRILEQTSVDGIIELVSKAINRYGKIEELLTDRGFVFYSWRGVNRFEQYLEAQRIDHTHARPHHPQTLGKVEALNRRIQSELSGQIHFLSVEQAMSALKNGWIIITTSVRTRVWAVFWCLPNGSTAWPKRLLTTLPGDVTLPKAVLRPNVVLSMWCWPRMEKSPFILWASRSWNKELDDVRFENEGRKLAWEIHRVDELLAEKKNTHDKGKKKKP